MEYRQLGRTDINVSAICLGTMTWGEQNTESEAHEQMDYAVAHNVNFFDAAEMYPVPPKADTAHRTEEYIGTWLANRGKRDDIILATKVAGRSQMKWIRGGPRLNKSHIIEACESSLRRLQTDYIDLYQVHWPERSTNFFGKRGYTHQEGKDNIPVQTTLEALNELVVAGKVRAVGLSNETPWGVHEYLRLTELHGLPRVVSIQNPYNLLNRTFEVGLAEMAIRESVGLLAYSPLAFGMLTGKYENGAKPANARLTLWERFSRYSNARATEANTRYVNIAREHGYDPAQMALAYVTSRPFMTSNIIGATTMEQLKSNIGSAELVISDEALEQIEAVQEEIPNPAP
jgi:aryl-alcohol dehydrogenase-like predicted oxidoreductase